jgi:hypothetical protein
MEFIFVQFLSQVLGFTGLAAEQIFQLPECSKGQNDRGQTSHSSTKSKSYQLRSYPIAIVTRNTTSRWYKNTITLAVVFIRIARSLYAAALGSNPSLRDTCDVECFHCKFSTMV